MRFVCASWNMAEAGAGAGDIRVSRRSFSFGMLCFRDLFWHCYTNTHGQRPCPIKQPETIAFAWNKENNILWFAKLICLLPINAKYFGF